MATYEDCVREAGDWGPWQWRMEAAMLAPAAAASMATLSWLFTARPRPPDPAPAHYSVLTDLGAEAGGWVASLLPPAFMLGMLVGGPALGLLSDRAGRRAGLLASLALVAGAASLLPLLPHSAPWHASWRLVAGAGTQGALVTTFVYLVEWPGAGRGGVAAGLRPWGCTWAGGWARRCWCWPPASCLTGATSTGPRPPPPSWPPPPPAGCQSLRGGCRVTSAGSLVQGDQC